MPPRRNPSGDPFPPSAIDDDVGSVDAAAGGARREHDGADVS